jgi:hypothetical protein
MDIIWPWPVELELSWPSNFTHEVDVYFCDDLRAHQWEFFVAGEATDGLEALIVTDLDSTNRTAGFYRPGDATLDTDGDLLADDRERFIYKTDAELFDTDGDTAPDGWELAQGLDPLLDTDGAFDDDMDGLTDWWEDWFFATLDRDGNGDFDEDGITDRFEFEASTDPTVDETTSAAESYAYDALGRLSGVSGAFSLSYTLDDAGNLEGIQ